MRVEKIKGGILTIPPGPTIQYISIENKMEKRIPRHMKIIFFIFDSFFKELRCN